MTDLKIGVIGAGGRGRIARHAHKPGEGSRVTAICDIAPEELDSLKSDYGNDVFATDDYRELLEQELDALFVCSPDFLHEEHALAAMDRVKAIYLEKPMTITIDGCDRVMRKAKENGVRLFVGHNMRYMSIIRKMKKLIDNDEIGEVKSVWCRHFINYGGDAYFRDWHAERKYTTGLLLQKGAHDIDVIHYLCGSYSTRVSAFGALSVYDKLPTLKDGEKPDATFNESHWPPEKCSGFNPRMDVEDQSSMIMQMEKGIIGAYLQCHFTPDSCRNYTVIGTKGRIENIGDGPESPIMLWNRRRGFDCIGDKVFRGGSINNSGHGGADEEIVKDFISYARDGHETVATAYAARMAVATGYCATESLRNGGQPQDIPACNI
ncbi:MAG: Gfo/Idh/MocA family oxidoreductase [Planctomycetes bacterium]|nr:Gfo/Idh/MocA family oxidoreductase [Planctomycetota bacterium]